MLLPSFRHLGQLWIVKHFSDLMPIFSRCRRGNEPPTFAPARRSGGRKVIENASEVSEEEADSRDGDFNGTKASE